MPLPNGLYKIAFETPSGTEYGVAYLQDGKLRGGDSGIAYVGSFASDEMTAHGFRAMTSRLLNESGKWNPDAIERALAHGDTDKVRAAYHRGAHWKERIAMAQWWSDYLDELRDGARSA